jgi:hypothetical protein
MCLYPNVKATRQLATSGRTYLLAYKVVRKSTIDSSLTGPYQHSYKYKIGANKSTSKTRTYVKTEAKVVEYGIHVCLDKEHAVYILNIIRQSALWDKFALIRVKCYISDLIGVETGNYTRKNLEAAFRKIHIGKKSYEKGLSTADTFSPSKNYGV